MSEATVVTSKPVFSDAVYDELAQIMIEAAREPSQTDEHKEAA